MLTGLPGLADLSFDYQQVGSTQDSPGKSEDLLNHVASDIFPKTCNICQRRTNSSSSWPSRRKSRGRLYMANLGETATDAWPNVHLIPLDVVRFGPFVWHLMTLMHGSRSIVCKHLVSHPTNAAASITSLRRALRHVWIFYELAQILKMTTPLFS